MLQRISSAELSEWAAFYLLEPFGGDTAFIGHAITASTVANIHRAKGQRAYKIEEFMPKFEKTEQSVDEMIQVAQMLTIGMGGKDLRSENGEHTDESAG